MFPLHVFWVRATRRGVHCVSPVTIPGLFQIENGEPASPWIPPQRLALCAAIGINEYNEARAAVTPTSLSKT